MDKTPHPLNAAGDYYVKRDCCTLCGVPWDVAPELFSYDDSGCWVARQPTNSGEDGRGLCPPGAGLRTLPRSATEDLACSAESR
jgi:hypothetical protein